MSTRREVRERVMQALYAYEQGGGTPEDVLRTVLRHDLDADAATLRFAERLFLAAIQRAEETDAVIQQHVRNWEIGRIALVDRLILRMALTEILTFEDIPPKVSINEAIEIAKRFSTHKSGQFVNGILDASLLKLIDEGRIAKSGRGLVGMPQRGSGGSGGPRKGNDRKADARAPQQDARAAQPEAERPALAPDVPVTSAASADETAPAAHRSRPEASSKSGTPASDAEPEAIDPEAIDPSIFGDDDLAAFDDLDLDD